MVLRVSEIVRGNGRNAFLASYSEYGQLPFLVVGDKIEPLADSSNICPSHPEAFRLNGTDFLALQVGQCETDNGGTSCFELGGPAGAASPAGKAP